MQVALLPLLIASVLMCPLRCMGAGDGEAGASVSQASPHSCCGGCEVERQPPGPTGHEQRPFDPTDDCRCASCLCHGAMIVDAGTDLADCHLLGCVMPLLEADAQSPLSFRVTAAHASHFCHFPPHVTGRDICALTCSLLL